MKPRLLDLFCCQGGAGEGYRLAGFDVTGVDIAPQPRNPHRFIQADALEYVRAHGHEYDAIHASPPCQFASTITPKATRHLHHNFIPDTRTALLETGKPFVIENVGGARMHLINPFMLCGTMFGLVTKCGAELQRHRYFEASFFVFSPHCRHGQGAVLANIGGGLCAASRARNVISVNGDHPKNDYLDRLESRTRARNVIAAHGGRARNRRAENESKVIGIYAGTAATANTRRKVISVTGATPQQNVERNEVRETFSVQDARDAMQISWMTMKGLSQAIPPAYTRWIGERMMKFIKP